MVKGTYPKKIPFRELGTNLASLTPGGLIQVLQPKVQSFDRSSVLEGLANWIGDLSLPASGKALESRMA